MEAILRNSSDGIKKDNGSTERAKEECTKEQASDMGADGKASASDSANQLTLFERMEPQDGEHGSQLEAQNLTSRQREVLAVFRRLKSTTKAADELGMRRDTMRQHMQAIRDRLCLGSIAELLRDGDVLHGTPLPDSVTAARLLELIESQGYRCALSGVSLTPETAVLDHKTPRSEGGAHVMSNVWFVHRDVNRAKGTMTVEAFKLMCTRVAQWSM
jgi:5-methylcytosine-specific restriction endonuclease McrA